VIEDRWLTVKELMAYLKLGKSKVYKLLQEGAIPASRIGKSWRIDRHEVDAWMKSQRTIPTQADLESELLVEMEVLGPEKRSVAAQAEHRGENPDQTKERNIKTLRQCAYR